MERLGDIQGAITNFATAVSLAPDNDNALVSLGIMQQRGDRLVCRPSLDLIAFYAR